MDGASWVFALVPFALLVNVAALVVALRRRLGRQKAGKPRPLVSLIPTVLFTLCLLGLCGTTVGVIKAFGAVGGESIDPSQKARILAEGISEAMNCTAIGLLLMLPASIGFLIYAAVVRRRAAR
jgi:hypothetical protein